MLTSLTPAQLTGSVLAVPPLCRKPDYSLDDAENAKLIRHIEAGGIRTLLYGGNANFYHVALSEYDALLSLLAQHAGADTLVIPSAGPAFGTMMDQAKVIRRHRFPTVMVLPQGSRTWVSCTGPYRPWLRPSPAATGTATCSSASPAPAPRRRPKAPAAPTADRSNP